MDTYENTETKILKGGKIIRKVSIKKGRGYKSISKYRKGKKISTIRKPIHKEHIELIKAGKFIPGLFSDCKNCKTKKRRGGTDIEMGPEIPPVAPYPVPPDPERFARYERQMRTPSVRQDEAQRLFAGPNPEQRQAMEAQTMGDEDPLNMDQWHNLQIFQNTGGRSKRRRTKRRY